MKSKVGILSLGCPRNLVDSENIVGRLADKGYLVTDIDKADVAIINTCSFIEDARKESIDAILDLIELKKEGRLKRIIVYGCLAQRYGNLLKKELPEVDVFVGKLALDDGAKRFSLTPRHYAYLKICEGCVNNCSYCVIPKIKGSFKSLDMRLLLDKAQALDQDKVAELNIIGQDISGYGIDLHGAFKLPELIRKISGSISNIKWIRLLYLHPSRVSDELLDLIKEDPKICKYIDLPLQHINARILKLMRRGVKKGDIQRLLDKIRKKIPQAAIRTSFIVGFPSETDRDFSELMRFIKEAHFERLGVFRYSQEEGTLAYGFKKQVAKSVKDDRFNAVMSLQQEISKKVNKKFIGKTMDVLVDEKGAGVYLCRSQYDAPEVDGLVYLNSKAKLSSGDIVKAKITDTLEYDLVGELS